MRQETDTSTSKIPLDYAAPAGRSNRVANAVFWCCLYALGAVALITSAGITNLVILDSCLSQLCVLPLVVAAVLHAIGNPWRFIPAIVFLLAFGVALFLVTAFHFMQLAGMRKGGDFLLWLVFPLELAQLLVAIVGLGIAAQYRLWRVGSPAA